MNMNYDLPFKVGHLVEARSFIRGYRGSWFRCMVREVSWRKGSIGCILEYIDFPDEKKKWTKLYQIPPTGHGRMKNVQRELMVRPCYPPIYQEDQIENSRKSLEVAVIVSNDWKVGDLVDWWADSVHWCGELIQLLDPGKAKIKLPDPPIGEGLIDDVEFKDLRPTLLWSPEQGWILPVNQVDDHCHCCARLIQPTNQGEQTTFRGQKDTQMSTSEFSASCSSHASPALSSMPHTERHHSIDPLQNRKLDQYDSVGACGGEHDPVKLDDSATTRHNHFDVLKAENTEDIKDRMPQTRMKSNDEVNGCNESSESDTIEASIMKLEELACKVKWLKMVLNHGSAMLDNILPSWKFEENLVTATPKPESSPGTKETKTQGADQKN